jgi:hypothetical protein
VYHGRRNITGRPAVRFSEGDKWLWILYLHFLGERTQSGIIRAAPWYNKIHLLPVPKDAAFAVFWADRLLDTVSAWHTLSRPITVNHSVV